MDIIWKDIDGYEGLYKVSNTGEIVSLRKGTKHGKPDEYVLKPSISNHGYKGVTLYRSPKDKHKMLVHRIVAKAFVPNPNNYDCVNHKDENVLNNNASNLEWCTYAYNNAYGTAKLRGSISLGKNIKQYSIDGIHIATYNSIGIASVINNIPIANIRMCCEGKTQYSSGYIWKYE